MVLTIDSWVFADAQIQGIALHPVVGAYELRFGLLIAVGAPPEGEHYRAVIDGARVWMGTGSSDRDDLGFARPDRQLEIVTGACGGPEGASEAPGRLIDRSTASPCIQHLFLPPGRLRGRSGRLQVLEDVDIASLKRGLRRRRPISGPTSRRRMSSLRRSPLPRALSSMAFTSENLTLSRLWRPRHFVTVRRR